MQAENRNAAPTSLSGSLLITRGAQVATCVLLAAAPTSKRRQTLSKGVEGRVGFRPAGLAKP